LRERATHPTRSNAQHRPQLPTGQPRNIRLECVQQRRRIGVRVDRGSQRLDVRPHHHRRAGSVQPTGVSLQRIVQRLERFGVARVHLRDPDVLASRALWPLSSLERDGLSLSKIVETSFHARGVVKEVFVPVTCEDETEPFVTDETFDRAVHGRHGDSLAIDV
jgi:hypothetical protein